MNKFWCQICIGFEELFKSVWGLICTNFEPKFVFGGKPTNNQASCSQKSFYGSKEK